MKRNKSLILTAFFFFLSKPCGCSAIITFNKILTDLCSFNTFSFMHIYPVEELFPYKVIRSYAVVLDW